MKVFVIAMLKEAEPVIGSMTKKTCETVCGKQVYSGKLFGEEIRIVICGVGKVNAACGTQLAIDKLGADTIINIGVAGGLNGGVEVGKIYSVNAAVQYDFDLTQLNGTALGTLDECEENYLPLCTVHAYPLKRVATGDRFNDSVQDYKTLTTILHADIRDMELGAIAQACMHAGVKCAAFKIISDLAGSGSTTEQYIKNLAVCADTLKRELKNITEALNG